MTKADGVKVFEEKIGEMTLTIVLAAEVSHGEDGAMHDLRYEVNGKRVQPAGFKNVLAAIRTNALADIADWLSPESDEGVCMELTGIKDALTHYSDRGERGIADIINAHVAES